MKTNIGRVERVCSATTAAFLIFLGLRRTGVKRLIYLSAAGALVYRGVSGHCVCYESLGLDTTSRKSTPVKSREQITLLADPSTVYDFCRDLSNLEKVFTRFHTEPSREGKVYTWRIDLPFEKSYSLPLEISKEEANRGFSLRSTRHDSVISGIRFEFTPGPQKGETEVSLEAVYQIPGGSIGNRTAKLLAPAVRALLKANLIRLKNRLEAGEIPRIDRQVSGSEQRRRA